MENESLEIKETQIEKTSVEEKNDKKKSKKSIIIGIVIITILLIIIGIFSFFLIKNLKDNKSEKTSNNAITIVFNSKGGSEVKEITLKKGEKLKLPETKKIGFTFTGWYQGSTKIEDGTEFNEDATLNAKWEKEDTRKYFTIYFDTGGGTKIKPITQECGTPLLLELEAPEKEFNDFSHWSNKKNGEIYQYGLIVDCEDITFEANWVDKTISIAYYKKLAGKDEYLEAQEYKCEKNMKLKLPEEAPKIDGYKFIKWMYEDYSNAKDGDPITCDYNNPKIYALYEVDFGEKNDDNQPKPLEEQQEEINE